MQKRLPDDTGEAAVDREGLKLTEENPRASTLGHRLANQSPWLCPTK